MNPMSHVERKVISSGLSAPHGTAGLLEFTESLEPLAMDIRCFHRHGDAAEALIVCKQIIERLAQFENDIDADLGEN